MAYVTSFRRIQTLFNFLFRVRGGYRVILDRLGLYRGPRPYLLQVGTIKMYHQHWGTAGPLNSIIFFNEYGDLKEQRDHEIFVDVGAHIGTFSLYAASKAPTRTIYAFEPEPFNYTLLCENIALNDSATIKPIRAAVSAQSGTATLYVQHERGAQGHSIVHAKTTDARIVDAISLPDFFSKNHITRCDYLKLDCEGSEYDIICSLDMSFFRNVDRIFIEYHPVEGRTPEELIDHLTSLDLYEIDVDKTTQTHGHITCTRKTQ